MPLVAEGQILTGDQFAEPVRVETIKQVTTDAWEIGVSGLYSQKFRKVTLSAEDFKGISASTPTSPWPRTAVIAPGCMSCPTAKWRPWCRPSSPARFQWEEVLVAHYALPVRTITSGDQRS